MTGNLWTRNELILALNLYLKLPFGKLDSKTPEIINLARLIGRTSDAVSMRLNNFASVDPYHQQRGVVGLRGGIKIVQPIWDEFIENRENLLFESERVLAEKENLSIESKYSSILKGTENIKGENKIREVRTRVNQNLFRRIIMATYNNTCCITGLKNTSLLVAGHISPWGEDEANRLNFQNGIAINSLHDKAFEYGLITITPDYSIKVSSVLFSQRANPEVENFFLKFHNKPMYLPTRYNPDPKFLEYHNNERFIK